MTHVKRLALAVLLASIAAAQANQVPTDVNERGRAATVKVISDLDHEFGSGVFIAQSKPFAYILTAQHLLPTAKTVRIQVAEGKKYSAEVLARSAECDLAVLRLPIADGFPSPLKLAASEVKPKSALSLGWEKGDAPGSLDESLKAKVRLKKPGTTTSVLCWETERKPASGRSGGALVDEMGHVLGVATGHDGTSGYFIHAEEIHAFLRSNGLNWLSEGDRR